MNNNHKGKSKKIKFDMALIAVVIISSLVHGINMFHFPSYREDEGTYMSQAWSVTQLGQLAPYTYWYDHAPLGWLFIALWTAVTGGPSLAGVSINTGRIFMLVLHIVSTIALYKTVINITGRKDAAVIAGLIFGLTPLGIIFQRRVYLDNIMTFWLLISLYFFTKGRRLKYVIISALTFAFAVLSKESAIAFLPIMILATYLNSNRSNKNFAIIGWTSIALMVISIYPVYALLKGEFFASGTFLGGNSPHVSLIDALQFQYQRSDKGGFFLSATSSFRNALQNTWIRYGLIFITTGTIASIISLIKFKKKWLLITGMLTWAYILFTIRGQVLDWYIIPLVPLFALNISLVYVEISNYFAFKPNRYKIFKYGFMALVSFMIIFELGQNYFIFTLDQTKNEVDAIKWIKDNIENQPDRITMIDNYAFVDLNPSIKNIKQTNIHYYWKADTDPVIKYDLLNNDWNKIDYLLWTPALNLTAFNDFLPLIQNAYNSSHVIKRFHANGILGEGYPVEIREVNNKNGVIRKGWDWYKQNFITSKGQVIDPASNGQTTSEGQSYALLRAVWIYQGDRESYDKVLDWTLQNLKSKDKNLFAWLYTKNAAGVYKIEDPSTATDADEDIALSLLFAYKRWNDPRYLTLAQDIIDDIWKYEVIKNKDLYYVTSGVNPLNANLINPSYFSPATYRIFAQIDKSHPWERVADDSYVILNRLSQSNFSGNTTKLIPNWFVVDANGNYSSASFYKRADADTYGYDAFRTMWRVALDKIWFNKTEAEKFLQAVTPFFQKQLQNNKIYSVYSLNGKNTVTYNDISTNAGALSALYITKPEESIDMYSQYFWPQFKDGHWGDPTNYYNQNWAWFATALYANNLPDLWNSPPPPSTNVLPITLKY